MHVAASGKKTVTAVARQLRRRGGAGGEPQPGEMGARHGLQHPRGVVVCRARQLQRARLLPHKKDLPPPAASLRHDAIDCGPPPQGAAAHPYRWW